MLDSETGIIILAFIGLLAVFGPPMWWCPHAKEPERKSGAILLAFFYSHRWRNADASQGKLVIHKFHHCKSASWSVADRIRGKPVRLLSNNVNPHSRHYRIADAT